MTLRRYFWVMLCLCSVFVLFCGTKIPRAGLRDPGFSEDEIRDGWAAFSRIRDRGQVRGHYPYQPYFEIASKRYNLPLPLLIAIALGESDFDPHARSQKGCLGIMQIRWPGTAKDLGIGHREDLFDPAVNIDAGARYLGWLLRQFKGDYYLAVAAYNYGPNAEEKKRVPEGARWYAAYILGHLVRIMERPDPAKHNRWAESIRGSGHPRKANAVLILGFDTYRAAAGFAGYLKREAGELPLEISSHDRYPYGVYLTYKTPGEGQRYLRQLIKKTGIRPVG